MSIYYKVRFTEIPDEKYLEFGINLKRLMEHLITKKLIEKQVQISVKEEDHESIISVEFRKIKKIEDVTFTYETLINAFKSEYNMKISKFVIKNSTESGGINLKLA